jgi:hypothetical protein
MKRQSIRSRANACALLVLAACLLAGTSAFAADPNPWADGTQWISLRAGYAKSAVKSAGNALGGYGFGFTRFISPKWALGGHVQHDVLGRFGAASEIDIPITVEMTRHFAWETPLRPYLGFGTGAFIHKMYRTGADETSIRPGAFLTAGANAPINATSLIGVDARMVAQMDAETTNPVFPSDGSTVLHWSLKLNYARFF